MNRRTLVLMLIAVIAGLIATALTYDIARKAPPATGRESLDSDVGLTP